MLLYYIDICALCWIFISIIIVHFLVRQIIIVYIWCCKNQ